MYYSNWINNCKMINSAKSYKSFILKNDNENIIDSILLNNAHVTEHANFHF